MFEIIVPVLQALAVFMAAAAYLLSPNRIPTGGATYMAIRNNNMEMAMTLVRQTSKTPSDGPVLKDASKLLPKGKTDE